MTTSDKPLNKVEIWVAEHAAPIFGALAVLIVLGAFAVFWVFHEQGETQTKVTRLEPQVTRINKAMCDHRSLSDDVRARACAERIRVGLINCRRSQRCRAAYLALATFPPPAKHPAPASTQTSSGGGGALQQPSNHGHQHPSPGSQPGQGHGNGHGGGQEGAQEPAQPSPGAESPGQGGGQGNGQGGGESGAQGPQGGSTSGAGVEVCVELVNTCVEAEVGLGG